MTNSDLTIAIISYNSYGTIKKCLNELITSKKFKTIIVDNASTDDSAQNLKKQYPQAKLIINSTNIGYGRAANLAIKTCSTKYLFLINPDLKATADNTSQLLSKLKQLNDDVALLAPSVDLNTHIKQGLMQKEWVIGAAMMFNLTTMKEVGYFDENIFLFSEESDLCKRIRYKKLKILLDSDIYIEHLYRQSSPPSLETEALKDWHQAWSNAYFYHKHGMDHGRKNTYRVALIYLIKYLVSTNNTKRNRYKHRLFGTTSFLKNQPAFDDRGKPNIPKQYKSKT